MIEECKTFQVERKEQSTRIYAERRSLRRESIWAGEESILQRWRSKLLRHVERSPKLEKSSII